MSTQREDRSTSYDVRVWKVTTRTLQRGKSYRVRWTVAGQEWHDTFATYALAESFRAELLTRARRGEPFDVATGRPVSAHPPADTGPSWFEHACAYVDMKWPHAAGNSRRGIADTLATVTPSLLHEGPGRPDQNQLRKVLYGWAFNARRRAAGPPNDELVAAARWITRNSPPLSQLAEASVIRAALDALALKGDGTSAAASTIGRKRAVLFNVLEYGVELGHLATNPILTVRWRAPRNAEQVDPQVVVNHRQARSLLEAVRQQGPTGQRLVAFFALLYYAALRPAEAADLRKSALSIPEQGWGALYLPGSAPTTGAAWGDSGTRRDRRGLKHRPRNEVRVVPSAPPLTILLQDHLNTFGTAADGRLFLGARGGDLSESTYGRIWQQAREQALSAEEAASPLARNPYALRHAAVSTWLGGGVPATQVAQWAGHSVEVLHRVYAKCVVGQQELARTRIEAALRLGDQEAGLL